MNVMTYKTYIARVDYDAEDRLFIGRIAGLNDIVGFHGNTVETLENAFHEAVDDYIAACAKAGKPPEKPYSGRVMFRVDPRTHAQAALAAQLRGVSLNQWAEDAISKQAEADLVRWTPRQLA